LSKPLIWIIALSLMIARGVHMVLESPLLTVGLLASSLAGLGLVARLRGLRWRRPAGERQLQAARRAHARGRLDEAHTACLDAIEHLRAEAGDPEQRSRLIGEAYLAVGDIEQARGRAAEALAAYQEARKLVELSPEQLGLIAADDAAQGRADAAAIDGYIRYLSSLTGRLPVGDPVVAWLKQLCRLGTAAEPEQLRGVVALTSRLSAAAPTFAWVYEVRAQALAGLGYADEAIAALMLAEQLAPRNPAIPLRLGELLRDQGRIDQASAALRRALALDPRQPQALLGLAGTMIDSGTAAALDEAADCLVQVTVLTPREAEIGRLWGRLGRALAAQGDQVRAADAFARVLDSQPDDPDALFALGAVREHDGDVAGAVPLYRRAVALRPDWTDARVRLGVAQARAGLWQSALEHLGVVERQGALTDEAAFYHGLALAETGRYREALGVWAALQKRRPDERQLANNLTVLHDQLGRQCFEAGDDGGALDHWGRCVRDRPDVAAFHSCLAAVYLRLGYRALSPSGATPPNAEVAATLFDQAIALVPADPRPRCGRALAALAAGDGRHAIELLDPLRRRPGDGPAEPQLAGAELEHTLALAYLSCGRADAAAALLTGTTAGDRAGTRPLIEARLALAQGDVERAVDRLRLAVRTGGPPVSRRALALLEARRGDLDAALALLPADSLDGPDRSAAALATTLRLRRAVAALAAGDASAAERAITTALAGEAGLEPRVQALLHEWYARRSLAAQRDDEALDRLEQAVTLQPTDLVLVRSLAALAYRRAAELAAGPDPARSAGAWRTAIAAWAMVLTSDVFWAEWQVRRLAAGQEKGENQAIQLRETLEQQIVRDLRDAFERCAATGRASEAEQFRDLELGWLCEVRTAQLMAQLVRDVPPGGWPAGVACGPLMLDRLRAGPEGRALVAAIERAAASAPAYAGRLRSYLGPLGRCRFLIDEGRFAQAIAELEASPPSPEARAAVAQVLKDAAREMARASRWDEAITAYAGAAAGGADLQPEAAMIAAVCSRRAQQILESTPEAYDRAIAVLDQGLQLAGNQPGLHERLAAIYTDKASAANNRQAYADAVPLFRIALQHDPANPRARHAARIALVNLAATVEAHNPDAAVELLKEAVGYEPHARTEGWLADLLARRALESAHTGAYKTSIGLMSESLQYDPETTGDITDERAARRIKHALLRKVRQYAADGAYAHASRLAGLARLYGDDQQSAGVHAGLLLGAGHIDEAARLLRATLDRAPSDPDLRRLLAHALLDEARRYEQRGDGERALGLLTEALTYDGAAHIHGGIAVLQLARGRFDEALATLRAGHAVHPDDTALRRQLRETLEYSATQVALGGDIDRAIALLREVVRIAPGVDQAGPLEPRLPSGVARERSEPTPDDLVRTILVQLEHDHEVA
jgi:tetratricopeptide (TPR) repeat protein